MRRVADVLRALDFEIVAAARRPGDELAERVPHDLEYAGEQRLAAQLDPADSSSAQPPPQHLGGMHHGACAVPAPDKRDVVVPIEFGEPVGTPGNNEAVTVPVGAADELTGLPV